MQSFRTISSEIMKQLGPREITVWSGARCERLSVQPGFRLGPNPQLVFEFEGSHKFSWVGHEEMVSARLYDGGPAISMLPLSMSLRREGIACTILPTHQPCTVLRGRRSRLSFVEFDLINFPDFFGKQDEILKFENGGAQRIGHIVLKGGPWTIELTAPENLKEIGTDLKQNGGYATTHVGKVYRSSGKSFSIGEAEGLFEALRLFLSFARGAFCSPCLVRGYDTQDELAWEKWGTHLVERWLSTPGWFDKMHAEILSEVFPGFWNVYIDPKRRETIRMAIYWYLRSNLHGHGVGVDGGLILSQAALERLAFDRGYSGSPATKPIRRMLSSIGIDTDIPTGYEGLKSVAAIEGWDSGPRAIVEIRNELIHPRQKHHSNIMKACFEAWSLAQSYIELSLLHLFNHQGAYQNRIDAKWVGEVTNVPWAQGAS